MKGGFLSIFVLLIPIFGKATDSLALPAIYPSNLTAYDIDPGIPAFPHSNVLIDQKGRLWVNPLAPKGHAPIKFYQFDGKRSHFQRHSDSIAKTKNGQTILKGMLNNGFLFGFIENSNFFFLFDPDHFSFQYFKVDQNEEIINAVKGEENDIYILAKGPDYYLLYSIIKGELTVFRKSKFDKRDTSNEVILELGAVASGSVWLVETVLNTSSKMLSEVNLIEMYLNENRTEKFDLIPYFDKNFIRNIDPLNFLSTIAVDHEDKLLFSFNRSKQLYEFDTKTKPIQWPN